MLSKPKASMINKLLKILGSIVCAWSIALPVDALATPAEDLFDNPSEQATSNPSGDKASLGKDCHLAFVTGDFGLQTVSMKAAQPINTLVLFVSGSDGKIIKDAQVITTVIDHQGIQESRRAQPFKGGYLVAVDHLHDGQYRVEAEIVTNGQLLTDEFLFNKG